MCLCTVQTLINNVTLAVDRDKPWNSQFGNMWDLNLDSDLSITYFSGCRYIAYCHGHVTGGMSLILCLAIMNTVHFDICADLRVRPWNESIHLKFSPTLQKSEPFLII